MIRFGDPLRRPRGIYPKPRDLLHAAADIFHHVEETPLQEEVVVFYQGEPSRTMRERMRAFTLEYLLLRLGMNKREWNQRKEWNDEWRDAIERVELVIETQQYEGAAAGLLNAAIVGRKLGLADRNEISGPDGAPIKTETTFDVTKLRDETLEDLMNAAIDASGSSRS